MHKKTDKKTLNDVWLVSSNLVYAVLYFFNSVPDIVDIKPANMEELTEVITAAEFHPHQCNTFVYSSSKGTIRLCDMRASALCDKHSKCKYQTRNFTCRAIWQNPLMSFPYSWKVIALVVNPCSVWRARRPQQPLFLFWDHLLNLGCKVQSQWPLHDDPRLPVRQNLGHQYGESSRWDIPSEILRLTKY